MIRKFVLLSFFGFFSSVIYGLNIYTFELKNDEENLLILENVINIVDYNDVCDYLDKAFNKNFDVNIEAKEIIFFDKNNTELCFLEIDIISNTPHSEFFYGPMHRSLALEEIILNLLQPGVSKSKYPIDALIIQLNGCFLSNIDYDMVYQTIVTKTDTEDWIYEYLYPNK